MSRMVFVDRVPSEKRGLVAAAFLTAFASLGTATFAADISVTDDAGTTVTLARPARRIISLAPHVTELLFASGAGSRIVGTTRYSDYPPAALDIPRIGDSFVVDTERVLRSKPDVIIVWLHGNADAQLDALKRLGIPVFSSEPRRLSDISSTIRRLGTLSGTESVAEPAAQDFERGVAALRARHAGRPPVRVFYQVAERPLLTINREHLIADVLQLCGATNVFGELPALTPAVTAEAVAARDPEAIVTSGGEPGNETGFALWSKLKTLTATRRHNFILLHSDLISRQSPRILDGAQQLCDALERVRRRR